MKALMLDVDGVVLKSDPPWTTDMEDRLGIKPDDLKTRFFDKHWHKIIIGQEPIKAALSLALERLRTTVSAEQLLEFWFSQDAVLNTELLDDLADIRASGVQVVLTTNQESRRAAYLMDDLGLKAHVHSIVYSANIGARKPHAAFFKAASQHGIAHDDHLLVDDTEANIKAAQKFGWQAHHWTGRQTLKRICEIHTP